MASGVRKRASLLLLLLAAVAVTAPAASAAGAGGGRCGPQAIADEGRGESSARCQWLLAAPCCDEMPSGVAAPAAVPLSPSVWTAPSTRSPLWRLASQRSPAATAEARAIATTVLRL